MKGHAVKPEAEPNQELGIPDSCLEHPTACAQITHLQENASEPLRAVT